MLNVQDECDLPEDDGYDLFTRETEVERYRWNGELSGAKRRAYDVSGTGPKSTSRP